MIPAPELIERFRGDLDPLAGPELRIGLAVSGGSDSLALLLLAAAARPGSIEVAAVDHALRPGSRGEAEMVAGLCKQLAVPHSILTVKWKQKPQTAVQERARGARYGLLTAWAKERGLGALATAHHLDDQIETFVMRLSRGAGIQGLAGIRRSAVVPGSTLPLLRPLLGWRHAELERVCVDAAVDPVQDPSNFDAQYERVKIRQAMVQLPSIVDLKGIGKSLAHLGQADVALNWATTQEWKRAVTAADSEIVYRPNGAPHEIRRRIVSRAIARLANEGPGELRGRELDQLMLALRSGAKATLRGVLCSGGEHWRFIPAPNRTRPGNNLR